MRKIYVLWLVILPILLFYGDDQIKPRGKTAYLIPIHGEIDRALMVFLKRGIDAAKKSGADYIIFDIDTFGGRVDSALQISTLIGNCAPSVSIAFVTSGPESKGVSWSAGALIAFSCDRIYMASGTSLGAAAPVYQTGEGMSAAPEKVVSAVRTQMAALAEKNGYPTSIAKAMVDKDIELLQVYLDEQVIIVDADEIVELERKAKKENFTLEKGKVICKSGKLLTLTAQEMEQYKVSSGTVQNIQALYTKLDTSQDSITSINKTASDRAVAFLTGSFIVSILVMIGLLALYMEISSPGFGIPGTAAIICFAIIFASNALLGKVSSLELLLFIAGIVLLVIEIFIIPGFGVTGITGLLCIIISLVLSLQDFVIPDTSWQWDLFFRNIITIVSSLVLSFLFFALLANILPRTKMFNSLALNTSQDASDGYIVGQDMDKKSLLHKKGRTVTILRPSGKADIEGLIYEVVSDGVYIEKNSEIEVIEVNANRIVVKKQTTG